LKIESFFKNQAINYQKKAFSKQFWLLIDEVKLLSNQSRLSIGHRNDLFKRDSGILFEGKTVFLSCYFRI